MQFTENDFRALFRDIDRETIGWILQEFDHDYARAHAALMDMSHISPRRLTDTELIAEWTRLERELLPEFAALEQRVVFVRNLMRSSRLDDKIASLEGIARDLDRRNHETFETTAARFVQAAFGLRFQRDAQTYIGQDPGGIANGNFYQGCIRLYNALQDWQRPLLQAAMVELVAKTKDPVDLQLICGLMLRGANECHARKQSVFTCVIDSSIPNTPVVVTGQGSDLERHKANLVDSAKGIVDHLKDLAFQSAFSEPTKLYFNAVRDGTMEGDVQVHGSNTYLAILLAATGIKLTRAPFLADEVKGVAQFRDALPQPNLNKLCAHENMGKQWEVVFPRREHRSFYRRVIPVQHNRFCFRGRTGRHIAEDCLRDNSHPARQVFLPYLQTFLTFFSEEVAVEWFCSQLVKIEGIDKSLDAIFQAVAPVDDVNDCGGMAKYWLWDVMDGSFRRDRAIELLREAGVCQ